MKRNVCIIICFFICALIFSTSCARKGDNIEMNQIQSLDSVLTQKYDLDELNDYFYKRSANVPSTFNGTSQNLHFVDVNMQFPVEVVRPEGYSVYAVNQGGLYYVFWSTPKTANGMVDGNPFVYFTAYLSSPKSISMFEAIEVGISTAEDVRKVDPNLELSFLMSNGIFSYSYLNDEMILEIEYDIKGELNSYNNLIVKKIVVVSRKTSPSKYGNILSVDLP